MVMSGARRDDGKRNEGGGKRKTRLSLNLDWEESKEREKKKGCFSVCTLHRMQSITITPPTALLSRFTDISGIAILMDQLGDGKD